VEPRLEERAATRVTRGDRRAHRDPSDNNWYFIDPYGVYSYPAAGYPTGVTAQATGACVRYSVSWKGGKPQYP
jgi:hypothetical protein